MTRIHSRWMVRLFGFPHRAKWVVVSVTLVSLSTPWVTAQTESLPPPPPGGYPFGSKVRVSPTMAILLICLISTFFIMGCVSVYVRQCVERRMARSFTLEADGVGASRRSRRRAALGLDPAVIDAFPTFMYSEVKGLKIGNSALECAVCLNEFEDDETLRLLPKCSHVFHPDCIDAWLSSHVNCPVCRANLIPRPGETLEVTVLDSDLDCEAGQGHSVFSPDIHDHDPQNLNLDNLIPDIQSSEVVNAVETPNQNNPRRSTPRRELVTGKFRRSYSTGHALVQPGENCDRFTLRLPEQVRNRLVSSSLSRTKSCVAFPRARSSRKGYRSSSGGTGRGRNFYYERFDRWGFTTAPPFFSRAGSARSPKMVVGGGEESTAAQKTFLKSVKSPLHRLLGATDSHRQEINVGERSFDRLRMDDQV